MLKIIQAYSKRRKREDFAVSFFEEMLADPTFHVFIALEEGKPIGYILCRLLERPENPFTPALRYLLIDQISVRPAVRGGAPLLSGRLKYEPGN